MTHTVAKAKRLVVEIRNVLRADHTTAKADTLMHRAERTMSDLVECVEYLSNPERTGEHKKELADSLMELRAEVWKVTGELNKLAGTEGNMPVGTAKLIKLRNRALKAIDKVESLLNVDRGC